MRVVRALLANPARVAVIAAMVCLLLGIAAAVKAGTGLPFPDEREYYGLAGNIAHHGTYSYDGVHPTAYRPPAYPLLLAGLRGLGLGVVGLRIAGAVLLALSVLLLFVLLRRIYAPLTAAAACCLTAVYPVLIYTATRLYPQALSLALLLALLVAGENALRARAVGARVTWAGGAGLAWGALLLDVPALAGVALVAAGVALVTRLRGVSLAVVASAVLCAAILPAAWAARNESALGALVPVSTNTGVNLLLGNSPKATATSGATADYSAYARVVTARHLDEVQANSYYFDAAVSWIRHHPGRAVVLYVEKVLYYFSPVNRLYVSEAQSTFQSVLAAVTFVPLLLLFVVRLVLARLMPIGRGEALLVLLVVLNALVQAIAFPRVRFRVPLDPFMIAVVVGLVVQLVRRRTGRAMDGVQYRHAALNAPGT